jgi:hypothetical protein
MADGFSTESYPKPPAFPAQKSMLDQAQQFQQLEQGNVNLQRSGIALSQDKVKQVNDQFQIMNAELASMADPKSVITKQQAAQRLINLSKTFGFKPDVTQHMIGELQAAPDVPTFAKVGMLRGQDAIQKFNSIYGTVQYPTTGQQVQPVAASPMTGVRPIAAPFQIQAPPTQIEYDELGQQRYRGPQAPSAPPGIAPLPGGLPVANRLIQPTPIQTQRILPVGKGNLTNDGQVTGIDVQEAPATFAQRYSPTGGAAGAAPLFEEGKKAYSTAQLSAGAKAQALKPLIQAIPLMQTPGFLSGPLTDQFTKAVAGLKSTGIISIADENDPTAIRQEAVKKIYQYLSNSPVAQRSDAAQTLKEAGSPNPNVQILPALIKLAKDQIALDRIEIAAPNAFKSKNYQDFLKHQGTFPQSVDERAFVLDQEPEEKSKALVDKMAKQTKSKNKRERLEAEKFFKSLAIADEQGFYK